MKTLRQNMRKNERGAALVTTVLVSTLLLTASVAMLVALGANSHNSTDVLSETKAYYAAESGLQATVNVVRNDPTVTYSYADQNQTLSAKLPYNWPTSGTATRVVIGVPPANYPSTGTAYSISVRDPDNSKDHTTFHTVAGFTSTIGVISNGGKTISLPDDTSTNRTVITLGADPGNTTVNFASPPANPQITSFQLTNFNSGYSAPSGTKIPFAIDYYMTEPYAAVRTLRGWFEPPSNNTPPTVVKFLSQNYSLSGSTLELCTSSTRPGTVPGCSTATYSLSSGASAVPLYLFVGTPAQPYRLQVTSTGYGPNGAKKVLEGVVERNLFNNLANDAAQEMIGPPCTAYPKPNPLYYCFEPGNSGSVQYSGGNAETGVPAFGFTSQVNLTAANTFIATKMSPGQVSPAPALLGNDIPDWQQSPASLDKLIDSLRTAAIKTGTYYPNPNGGNINYLGDYATGTGGVTFCEGSCKANADGAGILVVTGKLTNKGTFNFKGLIIVTGEEGWERNGAGGGTITGNVVIAPYNQMNYVPENLSSTFLPPRYLCSGCGSSGLVYADVSATIDNISAVSDFMLGVAEK
jgi:Tfp pilus assembly protein PilX